jgi:succinoglycan biosynthesis transport protein ExoP
MSEMVSQSQGVGQAQIALFNLEATAQSYRKLYDNFLQRHTESVQQQSFPVTEARALSAAAVSKTGPKSLQIWLTTIFAGGALGIGFGVLRELMDRGFRTKEQVQSALSLECLGLVPLLTDRAMLSILNDPRAITAQARAALPAPVGNTVIKRVHRASRLMRTVLHAPSSSFAEAVRMIKLNMDLDHRDNPIKVFGLTSSFSGEGKSSIAAAMAAVIAQSGVRTILVDCDLRNPSLSRALAPDATVGFIEAIQRTASVQELVWNDPASGLSFLPALSKAESSSSDLLASSDAMLFFTALRKVYDCIIVDLPPLIAPTDVRAASKLIDSFLLVVEWGRTKVDAVQYAMRHAPGVHERTIGIVLNKVDVDAMGRYDSYGASYYGHTYVGKAIDA